MGLKKYKRQTHLRLNIGFMQQNKLHEQKETNQTPWPRPASELCRPSERRLSAKLLPTFVDRGCHEVSVTDPYGRILGLDRSR
jgi:hypothetical protein